ncbi:MAG TPA: zf-HC2 domain-containing protein, partial [Acidobacteriota bacterium]|nr:zf-HC2 domain-containing protein [Acidobacteriota bacterium]
TCVDPSFEKQVFRFVFRGEPNDERQRIEAHLERCDKCRKAIEVWRRKAAVGEAIISERSDEDGE